MEFLNSLASKGIKLSVQGDDLSCYAQKGALTSEIQAGLVKHKPEILVMLRSNAVPRADARTFLEQQPAAPVEFPLSTGQKTHYLLQTLNPQRSYAVPICLKISGALDPHRLQQAWEGVLARHPVLTARITEREGTLYQWLDPQSRSKVHVEKIDVAGDEPLKVFLQQRVVRPFDLQRGPLARVELFNRPGHEHILLIVVHHIIFDGFSAGILLKSLFSHYKELSAGRLSHPRTSSAGYEAFVSWEQQMLSSEEGRSHEQFWREQLDGELPGFKLIPELLPAGTAAEQGEVLIQAIPEPVADWVRKFSRSHAVQPSAVFLAAFNLLVHKYTNQLDTVVVMPVAVRPGERFMHEIGYFFNVLPIRTRLIEQQTFVDLARSVQGSLLDAVFHGSYPFSLMLEKKGKPDGAATFKVLYAYQNFMRLAESTSIPLQKELGILPLEGFHQRAEGDFDLAFEVYERPDGFEIHLQSDPQLYPNDTIRAFLEHYFVLLRELSRNPDRLVGEYPIVSEAERRRVLVTHNQTEADYPQDRCIHDFFAEQVALDPKRVAVRFGEHSLTYQELYDKSGDLALYLQSLGAGPDSIVGLCVERSIEMMVGIMGIVRAGAAYLPLDPAYPQDRLTYMLEDSQARVVLTQERLKERISALSAPETRVIALDKQWPEVCKKVLALECSGVELREDVQPCNVNYVIYTSGSTGRPKGVLVEHRALVNRIHWMQKCYGLEQGDVVLQKTPYSFDVSVWEFFWPMMTGASLVFATPEGHTDVHYMEGLLNETGVTTMHFVPSMLHTFLDNARGTCPSVRRIFCSGEALDRRSVDRYRDTFPNATLYNLYGPTEAAIDVTAYDCSQLQYPFVPIGAPIDNTQIYILDRYNNPQPVGVPGELHIAGDNLARGYLNRPELTREKFVASPVIPGARMYKTGDLARWLQDGNIQYLGRIDVQVKIGGVRIETGEIEAELNRHPGVQSSVVVARGEDGYKQLVAFYRAKETSTEQLVSLAHADLRAHLLKTLPEYMIPAAFVSLAAIPLSSNGKVDRRALDRVPVTLESTHAYREPRNDIEQELVELWGEVFKEQGFVLEKAKIGIDDDFFELGGNSLLATQLIYKIRFHLGVDLPVRALFERTSIAQLAQFIATADKSDALPTLPTVNLDAEAVLDSRLQPPSGVGDREFGPGKSVLLTGASGFVGAYLLRDLLADSAAQVFCLIRCRSDQEGGERLKNNLVRHGLWSDEFARRIVPVRGDLAQPLLGVGPSNFDSLCETIDTVVHNGAWVNFIYPYSTLRNSNVRGTEELIRLASQGASKPLHYLSTLSIFPPTTDRARRIQESESPQAWREIHGGYDQSKWVAEKLVSVAGERGFPIRIYRLGTITGDSASGISNTGDLIPRMIKGCIQLGLAPDTDAAIGMVPVDYASRAIVHLSRQPQMGSSTFHIVNPNYVPVSELGHIFVALGYPIKVVPYPEWRQALLEDAKTSSKNALYPLLPLFTEETPFGREAQFDCRHTLVGLRGTPIQCPRVDEVLIKKYLGYFQGVGFLDS